MMPSVSPELGLEERQSLLLPPSVDSTARPAAPLPLVAVGRTAASGN